MWMITPRSYYPWEGDNGTWEEQGLFEQEGNGLFLDLNDGYKDVSLQTVLLQILYIGFHIFY